MNPKDIYLERFTINNTFEEAPLTVQPSSVVATDANNNLIMVSSASLTSSFAFTSSYSFNGASYPDITDLVISQSIGINQPNPQYNLDVNGTIGNSQGEISIGSSGDILIQSGGDLLINENGGNVYFGAGAIAFDQSWVINENNLTNTNGIITASAIAVNDIIGGNISCSVITASALVYSNNIQATTLFQLPYSSSNHHLTPTVMTGSAYFQSSSVSLLYVYCGTRWCSSSLA